MSLCKRVLASRVVYLLNSERACCSVQTLELQGRRSKTRNKEKEKMEGKRNAPKIVS